MPYPLQKLVRPIMLCTLGILTLVPPGPARAARDSDGKWLTIAAPQSPRPLGRRHHSLVWDRQHQRLIVFGGDNMDADTVLGDVWALELGKGPNRPRWVQLNPGSGPAARHGQATAYAPAGPSSHAKMYVHGGRTNLCDSNPSCVVAPVLVDDMWTLTLDSSSPSWTQVSSATYGTASKHSSCSEPSVSQPSDTALARWHHAATFLNGEFRLFGGNPALGGLSDQWIYTPSTSSWSGFGPFLPSSCTPFPILSRPNPRYFHTLITDSRRNRILTFGGEYDSECIESNVYVTSGSDWTRVGAATIGTTFSRIHHAAVYDSIGDRMIVIGGYDVTGCNENALAVVTQMDLSNTSGCTSTPYCWSSLEPTGDEIAVAEGAAVYDPDGDRVIFFGGVTDDQWGDYSTNTYVIDFHDTPPEPITDLDFAGTWGAGISLRWTAPFDDGATGDAATYDIRYATTEDSLTSHFSSCRQYSGVAPAESGVLQTHAFTGLPTSLIYLAIRSKDSANNLSALSNVVCFRISNNQFCDGGGETARPAREEIAGAAAELVLRSLVPNPSSSFVDVRFALARRGPVEIEVLDLTGRRVERQELGERTAGEHFVRVGERVRLAPGSYRVRLVQGDRSVQRQVVIIR